MGEFLTKPLYDQVGKGKFQLNSDLVYINFEKKIITIPKGFITDGYSKPQFTLIIKTMGGNFEDDIRPAVVHDWRCNEKNCTEKYASQEFLQAMIDVGIDKNKANKMYKAVRFYQILFCKGWKKEDKGC